MSSFALHQRADLNWGYHAPTELIDEGSYAFDQTSDNCKKKQGLKSLILPVQVKATGTVVKGVGSDPLYMAPALQYLNPYPQIVFSS